MQPTHVKLLAMVLVLFGGVGVYYYLMTSPVANAPRAEVKDQATTAPLSAITTSTNSIHLEKTANGFIVTGKMKEAINPASISFGFTGYGPAIDHEGTFGGIVADVSVENGKLQGGVVEFTMNTVDAGIAVLNAHLQSEDFFDVVKYPNARFQITDVQTRGTRGTMTGTLKFRGVEKELSLPFFRDGNSISADFLLDVTPFNFKYSGIKKDVRIKWKLSIK